MVQINIYDACGRIVESSSAFHQIGPVSVGMNITDIPAGMYIVSASAAGTMETARLIKIN